MSELKDGINECDNQTYHSDRKYLSSSVLKTIYKDLAEYKKYYIDGESKQFGNQSALDEGSLTHGVILEPHLVHSEFVFYPGLRKAGDEFEKFKASLGPASANKTIISKPQKLRVDEYVKAYKARPEAVQLISGGQSEQTICGSLHDIPIKVRFDYINIDKGYVADIKTTGYPADVDSFKQTLNGLSYQLSAALYCSMAEQFYGKKFDFYFVVISKADMECHVYKTSEKTMNEGRQMVKVACEKYKQALLTGDWTESDEDFSGPVSAYEILEV